MLVERYQYLSVFFFWISELFFIFLFPFLAFRFASKFLCFLLSCSLFLFSPSFLFFSLSPVFCFFFPLVNISSLPFPPLFTKQNEMLSPPFVLISSNSVWLYDSPLSSLKTKQKITDRSYFAHIFPRYIYIFQTFPGLTVYSATKYFVESLTQGLRLEIVGSGVKVTSIQPGKIGIYIN